MSNITNTDAVVTESKLTEFYNDIKPFLGCPAYLTSEGTSDYYSTDEKVIGRWTNGKPLYQKVISGNLPSSAGSTGYPHSISDVDEFTCVKGIVFWGGHESTEMPVINANSKAPVIFIPSINDSTVLINVDFDRSSTTFAVIIQYTKTTDSASTTIQEDPNEYSTDEKIIGKWTDGKPIYQKTISFTLTTYSDNSERRQFKHDFDATNMDILTDSKFALVCKKSGTVVSFSGSRMGTDCGMIFAISATILNGQGSVIIDTRKSDAYTSVDVNATIQYIKITD